MDRTQLMQFMSNLDTRMSNYQQTAKTLENTNYSKIEADIKSVFFNTGVVLKGTWLYGSRISGLANQQSDLDVALSVDHVENIFERVLNRFRFTSTFFTYITHVQDSRNKPFYLITARHNETGITCDLVFNEFTGYYKAHGLKQLLKLQDPEARKFLIFLRNLFDLSDLKNLKINRAIDMMAIYFLQMHGYLPGFKFILKDQSKRESLEFMGYSLYHYGLKPIADYKRLVRPFFQYYQKFNWTSDVVCVYLGSKVSRAEFPYKSDLSVHTERHQLDMSREMLVLDFIDLSKNYAKQMTVHRLSEFNQICQFMNTFLANYPGFF